MVPGDEAANRVPDPTVHSEVLFQEAQELKKRASEAFELGDAERGKTLLDETRSALDRAELIAPAPIADGIAAEKADVERMSFLTDEVGAAYMSKMTRASYHRQNRKRGRREE